MPIFSGESKLFWDWFWMLMGAQNRLKKVVGGSREREFKPRTVCKMTNTFEC